MDTEGAHLTLKGFDKENFSTRSTSVGSTPISLERLGLEPLDKSFCAEDVQPWKAGRFAMVTKLQDAPRSEGAVLHMVDAHHGLDVAMKVMPNEWVGASHQDFMKLHPHETEHPWKDIGCVAFLNSVSYPYVCDLLGVYRDASFTRVVTELATEGDLVAWCMDPLSEAPGPAREEFLKPIASQILDAVTLLHDMSIVHGDVSLENIVLSRSGPGAPLRVKLIDFGMASTSRSLCGMVLGKPSYQAPEMHKGEEYDGFRSDAFAVGVTLFTMLVQCYPWPSTRPGSCKSWEFFARFGLRKFCEKKLLPDRLGTVSERMSEPVKQLLGNLLEVDPSDRAALACSEPREAGLNSAAWPEPGTKFGLDGSWIGA